MDQSQVTINRSTEAKPKRNFSLLRIFIVLFFCFLGLVLGAAGATFLIYSNLANQTNSSTNNNVQCNYNKLVYKPGESFKSTDGCNTCSCTRDGGVVCTEMACANDLPTSAPSNSVYLFDKSDIWFNNKPYPTELLSLVKTNVHTVTCDNIYTRFGSAEFKDDNGITLADSDTKNAVNLIEVGKTISTIRKCSVSSDIEEYRNKFYLYNYCNESCGGGVGTQHGLLYFQQGDNYLEFANTTGAYPRCMEVLAYTKSNMIYLNCEAGDGPAGQREIYKLDLNTNIATSLIKDETISEMP